MSEAFLFLPNLLFMTSSKQQRLEKIINPQTNRTVIVPLDHGVSDGPIAGLIDMKTTLQKVIKGGANAIVLHKGLLRQHKDILQDIPVLCHISASTTLGVVLKKVLVATVEEVAELGAVGVSIQVNLGNIHEPDMLRDFGKVSGECQRLGLPLLVMMYVRDLVNGKVITETSSEKVKHAARLASELGADIVKVSFTGSGQSFQEVVLGCPIPVVIAGGAKGSEQAMLQSIQDCMDVGATGVSVGRNVFQHEDVVGMLQKVCHIVHGT
jgi:predicted phospho-2-dehydro-3-deoxyheptonate aldolase